LDRVRIMFYSASLLYRSVIPGREEEESLWEDSIVLIEAASEEDALDKAKQIGKSAEHDYVSATDEHVSWAFVRVDSVCEIGSSLSPGCELFSRFLRASEARSLLSRFGD
jgi:Domain of unknown function (DUF4288)